MNNHRFPPILEFALSLRAKSSEPEVSQMFGNPLPGGNGSKAEGANSSMGSRRGEALEGGLGQERHKVMLRRLWEQQGWRRERAKAGECSVGELAALKSPGACLLCL